MWQLTVQPQSSPTELATHADNKATLPHIVQVKAKVEGTKVAKEVRTNKAGTDQDHRKAPANPQARHQDLKVSAINAGCMATRGRTADVLRLWSLKSNRERTAPSYQHGSEAW